MPRFLAVDYFTEALEERQNALFRMVLAVPSHLECIDNYIHKGKKDNRTYNIPWYKVSPDKLIHKAPQEELSCLTSRLGKPEQFSESLSQDGDYIPSSNPDSPPINFDVWSDLEVEVVNYLVESFQSNHEERFTENLSSSEDDKLLEEQASHDYLSNYKNKIPSVTSLCSRLKPKIVQDPFSDSKGEPVSEESVIYRKDKIFQMSEEETKKQNSIFKETFTLQQIEKSEDNLNNLVLEMPNSPENILYKHKQDTQIPIKSAQEDIIIDTFDGDKITVKEELADFLSNDTQTTTLEKPEFTPDRVQLNTFIQINEIGSTKTDSLDKKFESPIMANDEKIPHDKSNTMPCEDLSKMTISPCSNAQVVSPSTKTDLEDKIWQNEKTFNDILVKILPIPKLSHEKKQSTAIPSHLKKKELIKGDLELELPWDPFVYSKSLGAVQKGIHQAEPLTYQKKHIRQIKKPVIEKYESIQLEDMVKTPECPLLCDTMHQDTGKSKPITSPPINNYTAKIEETEIKIKNHDNTIKAKAYDGIVAKRSDNAKYLNKEKDFPRTPNMDLDTFSSLDDFLHLRSMCKTPCSTQSQGPPKTIVKAIKVRPSISTPLGISNTEKDATMQTQQVSKNIIQVETSTEYQEVIDFLISSIHPFLARLKEQGIIKQEHNAINLTPSHTRFAVKQTQMAQQMDEESEISFKLTVCLHVLVGALQLTIHFGLGAAIAHLSHAQEKYASTLGSALDSIRRHLFNAQVKFQQNCVLHPKIVKILDTIKSCLANQNTNKVLIVCYAHIDYIFKQLQDILTSFDGVQVSIMFDSQAEVSSNSNVVIADANSINDKFPWYLFGYVIEFEKVNNKVPPQKEDIQYIALTMNYGTFAEDNLVDLPKALTSSQPLNQYIFIGSTKIVKNVKLLHLLEARHNIMIYERDYKMISKEKENKMILQPDVMVDERTCVILEELIALEGKQEYEKLRDKVLSISLKCTYCYVIFYYQDEHSQSFPINDKISSHLSMIFANVAHFKQSGSDFHMKILFCDALEDVAIWIRRIGDETRQTTKAWDKDEWLKRKWMTDEITRHEKFLLSFPCINSFSAQVMLTAAPLARLLTMSLPQLFATLPWIPQRILNMFYQTTHLAPSIHTIQPSLVLNEEQNPHITLAPTPGSNTGSDDSLWMAIQKDTSDTIFIDDSPPESNKLQKEPSKQNFEDDFYSQELKYHNTIQPYQDLEERIINDTSLQPEYSKSCSTFDIAPIFDRYYNNQSAIYEEAPQSDLEWFKDYCFENAAIENVRTKQRMADRYRYTEINTSLEEPSKQSSYYNYQKYRQPINHKPSQRSMVQPKRDNCIYPQYQDRVTSNIIGIAQPQRRIQSSRIQEFDKGSRSTYHACGAKKVSRGSVMPFFESSPDEFNQEMSISRAWSEGQIPNKKQKLTYEKIPGSKDGQTKLVFS